MAAFETDTLAELIQSKRECLLQLRELARRQLELIDGGEMTALLDLLAAKQRLLTKLQQTERGLDPFRGQDPHQRRWRSPEDRHLCNEQLRQCELLLAEIISQEKCGEGALRRRRDQAASRLQGANSASRARDAYTARSDDEINQLDLLSNS